ncbi:MAG TPA: class I SAM-dependent methyltransferase [Blastocatellia bacterium]|nr:class I SAM-dependent methyltransferase [Blastocatellia bacterium]
MSLSELFNPHRYDDPEWRALHEEIATYSVDKHVFLPNIYRKGWEWTQIAYALTKLHKLQRRRKALGVAVGHEALLFWLADRLEVVVGTDLFGNATWFSDTDPTADPSILLHPEKYCPRPYNTGALHLVPMDGLRLGFKDNTFDIVWSTSSIEHFGGHAATAEAIREQARVLRRGGILAVVTEYLLLDEYSHPEYLTRREIEEFIIGAADDLELIEPIDYKLPPVEYLIDSVIMPSGRHRTRRAAVLNDGNVQWTSIAVFLRKRRRIAWPTRVPRT